MIPDVHLIAFLSDFLSERRLELINKVIDNRTYYLTVVLEDIFQSQNASAVLRTCDCLGIQNLHVIENRNQYHYHPGVAMGSGKWVTIHRYSGGTNNTGDAIQALKKQNYRIIVTMPDTHCTSLDQFNLAAGKTAIIIGSEIGGVSREFQEQADECISIPMAGFTESFNLSVSAAIILYDLMRRLKKSELPWQLSDTEKNKLRFEWIKSSLKKPELLIKKYKELRKTEQIQ